MKLVLYEKQADENKYMYIMHWDSMKAANFKFHDYHIHRAIELVVCEEGEMSIFGENNLINIKNHDLYIYNSFDKHFYEYVNDFRGYIIVLTTDFICDIVPSSKYEFNNVFHVSDHAWEKFNNILTNLFLNNGSMSFLEKKANVLLMFDLLEKNDLIRLKNNIDVKDISTEIMEYIANNYATNITLESISKHFGYSKNYFSSFFSKIVGDNFSFKTYLNYYRLNKVNELKSQNAYKNESIKRIIKMCGFGSYETYYRVLKKYQN